MKNLIKILLAIIIIIIGVFIIQTRNFNGFNFANYYEGRTKISRDVTQKYNKEWSYKIESKDYNDFMFYKTINVKKNTAYKVSCMVKTKDIESESGLKSGFNICIKDNLEKSQSIIDAKEWTNLEFYFNSNNNEKIDIAFRLGENTGNCKGIAWFSNVNIETGKKKSTRDWNFAVFMINETNAKVNNKIIKEKLTNNQEIAIKNCITRFKDTLENFSNYNLKVNYDLIYIKELLSSLSYSDDSGYYVSPEDVNKMIDKYLYNSNKNYDHIFVVANIGDTIKNKEIDWIGLGGMVYNNIGYSNIRISQTTLKSYVSSSYNYFPEEVFLHEFLHTLERNSIQIGNQTIALHDYSKYGYKNESKYGQKKWYRDYIQKTINGNRGLEKEVLYTQPVSKYNFIKKEIIDIYNNQNIIQKILEKISTII